jgi:ribonuclease P protein component
VTATESFGKHERLYIKKRIEQIFKKGKSFIVYPFRVVYCIEKTAEEPEAQILITVPKRNIKLAVGRNRIKRLIREAYRHNKFLLLPTCKKYSASIYFSVIFLGNTPIDYSETDHKIKTILERLCHTYEEDTQ